MAASLLDIRSDNSTGIIEVSGAELAYVQALPAPSEGPGGSARQWVQPSGDSARWLVSRKVLQHFGLIAA